MTKGLGPWLIGYGVVLFFCGVAAFQVNPQFPLLLVVAAFGGGVVSALGVISMKGGKWVPMVANLLTLILMMAGLALVMQYVLLFIQQSKGLPEAIIAFVMFLASATALWRLKKKA